MILKGIRVILRPPLRKDLNLINKWLSDNEIWKMYSPYFNFLPYKYLSELPANTFVICDSISKQTIGFVVFRSDNKKEGIYDIVIGEKKYWKTGIAVEVTVLFLGYLFFNLNISKVKVSISAINIQTLNAAKKFGFKEEIRIKKRNSFGNLISDVYWLSLSKDAFKKNIFAKWYYKKFNKRR